MGKANFSDEFKRDAVAQITERGYRVAEVSQRLGVSQHSLYAWKRQFARRPEDGSKDAEIRQLKRELLRVTEERDILKKATAYLTFGHFVPPGMQSEIRVRCRASHAVPGACDVPVSSHPAQRLLRLVEETAEQTGEGRCSADRAAPAGVGRQRQGLWLPQTARRPARSGRDLLPEPRGASRQSGGY